MLNQFSRTQLLLKRGICRSMRQIPLFLQAKTGREFGLCRISAPLPCSLVVMLQKRVHLAFRLVAGEGVERDGVDAVGDGFFDVGVVLLQSSQQRLDFLTL